VLKLQATFCPPVMGGLIHIFSPSILHHSQL
jgi:hypothetical protein